MNLSALPNPGDYGFISGTLSPDKVLAVPENDPRFLEMRDLPDLPKHLLKDVEYFFNIYKEFEGRRLRY